MQPTVLYIRQAVRFSLLGIFSIVLASVMSLPTHSRKASAQSSGFEPFYVATSNASSLQVSIWEVQYDLSGAEQIATFANTIDATPSNVFPEAERILLNEAINTGNFGPGRADSQGIRQTVDGIWLLDTDNLLILTFNSIIDTRYGSTVFGYYEFHTFNLQSEILESLTKIDYHHPATSQWGCTNARVQISDVRPNPTLPFFSYTIIPTERSCFPSSAQSAIVEYSSQLVQIYEIPFGRRIAWSPDGQYLAYSQANVCSQSPCNTSLQVVSPNTAEPPIVLRQAPLLGSSSEFVTWIDNETTMYSWLVSPAGGEGSPTIFWQDIIDLTFIEATNDLHIQGQLVYLSGTPAILAGITVDGAVTILSADSTVNILAGFPVPGRMFYNSRFNQYLLFVDNQATPNQLTLVDTNLTVSNLDLSGVLPGNEVTFLASPGHIGEGVPSSCDPVFTILDGDTAALISAIESANGTPEPTPSAWRRAEPTPSQRHTGVPLLCPKSPATSPSKATTPPSPAMSLPPISASFRLRVQAR